jgi:hypothetical protein
MSDVISFIVHDEPALRSESDYIARIDLAPFGLVGQVEQVWLRRTQGGEATLCCIPFRAYGLALRDTVRISTESAVVALIGCSGNRTLRALISDVGAERVRTMKTEIDARIARTGLLYEWSGDRHVAIDVPSGADAETIVDYFDVEESKGSLNCEWGDVEEFRI